MRARRAGVTQETLTCDRPPGYGMTAALSAAISRFAKAAQKPRQSVASRSPAGTCAPMYTIHFVAGLIHRQPHSQASVDAMNSSHAGRPALESLKSSARLVAAVAVADSLSRIIHTCPDYSCRVGQARASDWW